MNRRRRALLALAFLLAALLTTLALPAAASTQNPPTAVTIPTPGTDCLQPPMPQAPTGPFAGWLDEGPKDLEEGDPFDPDSGVGLYDVYGYGGYEAIRFDPGCGWSYDPSNEMANGTTDWSLTAIGFAVFAVRFVMSGDVGSLWDPIQQRMIEVLGNGLFLMLIPAALLCTAVYFMAVSHRADLPLAFQQSANTMAVLAVVAGSIVYLMAIGPLADRGISATFAAAANLTNASADAESAPTEEVVAESMLRNVMYPTWELQTFGGDAAIAEEYGPRLFAAGAFTRAEYRTATAGTPGDAANRLVDKKQGDYKRLAEEIKKKSPIAYDALKGGDTRSRAAHSTFTLIAVLSALSLLLYATAKVLYATVVVRIGVGLIPAFGLIAQYPNAKAQEAGRQLLMWIVGAVAQACGWGVVFFLYLSAIVGPVMDMPIHPAGRVAMLLLGMFALYAGARRFGLAPGKRGSEAVRAAKRRGQRLVRWATPRGGGHPSQAGAVPGSTPAWGGAPPTGGWNVPRGAPVEGRTSSIGRLGARVPGMGHVYGSPDVDLGRLPHVDTAPRSAAAGATVPGEVIHSNPRLPKGIEAAMHAASLPRGTPGALAARGGDRPPTREEADAAASARAFAFPTPDPDQARLDRARAQIGERNAARRRAENAAAVRARASLYRPAARAEGTA